MSTTETVIAALADAMHKSDACLGGGLASIRDVYFELGLDYDERVREASAGISEPQPQHDRVTALLSQRDAEALAEHMGYEREAAASLLKALSESGYTLVETEPTP